MATPSASRKRAKRHARLTNIRKARAAVRVLGKDHKK
jgi:hypothetical protein